jgi:hypothetical protein
VSDTLILPMAELLLTCFCEALTVQHTAANRPAHCCLRVGESVSADASPYEDLCCEGLAWVRIDSIFASNDEFPNPDTQVPVTGCGVSAWGVVLEMGVLRCAPTGSTTAVPTCSEWTALAVNVTNDARAMRDAICCLTAQLDPSSVAIGSWNPLPTTGGCAGGSWQISVQIANDCEDC